MKHRLSIKVSKNKTNGGVVACRQATVRGRLMRFLLGSPVKLTVLVPGDSVEELVIKEAADGDDGFK